MTRYPRDYGWQLMEAAALLAAAGTAVVAGVRAVERRVCAWANLTHEGEL